MSNPTLERLFRHMAWANNQVFSQLSTLPESALKFSAWNPEWTVGKIANHIVIAEGRFLSRLQKLEPFSENEFDLTSEGMKELTAKSAENCAKLQEFIGLDDEMLTFLRYGEKVNFLTSTVLSQIVHHATEHRAQIADILAVNNMDVVNLDKLDHWSFERFER
ncbi:MAG: DinB family protein [Candidatus Nanopelagicaceae bacterium]|jgi:uncharacterized damage-inducible protein DinB